MSNELLLILQLVFLYGSVMIWYRLFGKVGLFCFTAVATIAANIETLLQIDAFGMSMTMGNILFACTFLITDILSELHSKKDAQKCVYIGISASLLFTIVTLFWNFVTVNENDFAFSSFQTIFTNTPRLALASLVVYFVSQLFDVWLYHKLWDLTSKYGRDKFLWLRNNGSTLVSQLLNTALFMTLAFWGIQDFSTIVSIILASYVIFIFTSLLDTPIIYMVRRFKKNECSCNGCKR